MTDDTQIDSRYRAMTAQAWSGMLMILLTMLIADVVRLSIEGPYTGLSESLAVDPGLGGLWILVSLICFNVLLQVAIRTFGGRRFRYFAFWASVAYTLFFLFHQVAHLLGGEGPSIHTLLDLTHHGLGAWACWAAFRWSRVSAPPSRALN